jgi:hypothetical protein
MRLQDAWDADGHLVPEDCTDGYVCPACKTLWSPINVSEDDIMEAEEIRSPWDEDVQAPPQ